MKVVVGSLPVSCNCAQCSVQLLVLTWLTTCAVTECWGRGEVRVRHVKSRPPQQPTDKAPPVQASSELDFLLSQSRQSPASPVYQSPSIVTREFSWRSDPTKVVLESTQPSPALLCAGGRQSWVLRPALLLWLRSVKSVCLIQVVLAHTLTPHHHRHRHHRHHVLAELCGRPADQHQNDQERRDRWPRWKYLGPQCRVSGKCYLQAAEYSLSCSCSNYVTLSLCLQFLV